MVLDFLKADFPIEGGEARRRILREVLRMGVITEEAAIDIGSLERDDPRGIVRQRGCIRRLGGEESFLVRFARIRLFHGEEEVVSRLGEKSAKHRERREGLLPVHLAI